MVITIGTIINTTNEKNNHDKNNNDQRHNSYQ